MTIEEIIQRRDIREVLHFTTSAGLLGILASAAIKSRAGLKDDQRLEFILKLNTPIVRDTGWEDYVNFSLTRINNNLFGISSERWHPDVWWCVLSFNPAILTHAGVVFTTTNNIYTGVQRGQGPEAMEAMYSKNVVRWVGNTIRRTRDMPPCVTTCEQAEVLYPRELSTDHLRTVYVRTEEDQDDVHGQLEGVRHRSIEVIVDPEKFTGAIG